MQKRLVAARAATASQSHMARSRPRVLHLITSFEAGGTERQAVELLKRLDREQFEVRLAAIRNEGPFYKEIASLFPNVPEFRLTSFYNRNAIRQMARLKQLILSERINIIHAHGFYDSLFASMAGRLVGVPVIASQRHLKLSDRRVHRLGTRAIHRLADRIVVNSEAIRRTIIESGSASAEKIVVIRNGLRPISDDPAAASFGLSPQRQDCWDCGEMRRNVRDSLCRELGLDPRAKLVGMVARLAPVKGHSFFIRAAARIAREEADVHFVLVGDGPLRREIEDELLRSEIAHRVHVLGNRQDARLLVLAFDVAVLASLNEGLPNAVMEAMSAGVPTVATAVGGTVELIADGETGYLVPPADAEALAARITFALKNEAASAAVAQRAREFITSRFSMQQMVRSVEKLYDEVMRERI
ncbi:MAG TPA: glycosyltransferase [Blastocatellia bacterium]|nr:glycosyltransferase [Blastocatellia bacterium]